MDSKFTSIIPFLEGQIPAHIRQENPNFYHFLRAYYEYMEQSGNQLLHARRLLSYADIDRTLDEFITYFKHQFLPNFPENSELDIRKLIKNARRFHSEKGSPESIKFLFNALYDRAVEIYYPKDNILRASDGRWNLPQAIQLILSPENETIQIGLLESRLCTGSLSRATCIIENAYRKIDPTLNREVIELYISNMKNAFLPLEYVEIAYHDPNDGQDKVFRERLVGSIAAIRIDPRFPGSKYRGVEYDQFGNITYSGDPVVIVGGLAPDGEKAVAHVANVSVGGVREISLLDGGYGFREWVNSQVDLVTSDDTGTGANVIVQSIDYDNLESYNVNIDTIEHAMDFKISASIYANTITITSPGSHVDPDAITVTFSDPELPDGVRAEGRVADLVGGNVVAIQVTNPGSGYVQASVTLTEPGVVDVATATINLQSQWYVSLSNTAFANTFSVIDSSLSWQEIQVAPIAKMKVVQRGQRYRSPPTLRIQSQYGTLLSEIYYHNELFADWKRTKQGLHDLGYILKIRVNRGGSNYDPFADSIVFHSATGYGASATFDVDGTGKIVGVTILDHGEGYVTMPQIEVISATGTGAVLEAFGFGGGARGDISVDDVGRVRDIRMDSTGFNYVENPIVSLRVQDIRTQPLDDVEFFAAGDVIYQGVDAESATYKAIVDSHSRATNVLRVYDHRGQLDIFDVIHNEGKFDFRVDFQATQPLITYGNGKARATAQFLNGLIVYDGYWTGTESFLSSDQYLQDDKKYHNFSYEVVIDDLLSNYKDVLLSLVHPSGTMLLTVQNMTTAYDQQLISATSVVQANTHFDGTVSIPMRSDQVTGTGTNFVQDAHSGDFLVVFSPTNARQRVFIIAEYDSVNDVLILDSDTSYIPDYRVTASENSYELQATEPADDLLPGDEIEFMDGDTHITATVTQVAGNIIEIDTLILEGGVDLPLQVCPLINNVAYSIVPQPD